MTEILQPILERQSQFMGFVTKQVRDPVMAADILQDAMVKAIRRVDSLKDPDAAVSWFYTILRHTLLDEMRKQGRELTRTDWDVELDQLEASDEVRQEVCSCLIRLLGTLKPDYEEIIRKVDMEDVSVKDYADERDITANNASVRLFRARKTLLKEVEECCGSCADTRCAECDCDIQDARI